ncbi:short chain dehydrogenase family protein [Mycobacterium xenopi 4042]|uniref:Short chain dehydrogenase family protein n=1 Tax=Mycobacterium xenopi 4042 TaxID=1299334 RepID=X8DKQ7_MYCXE|nr:short chain dehydrogenase family protein [Mycobacterium xenopi 4042]
MRPQHRRAGSGGPHDPGGRRPAFPYSVDMADSEQVRDFATSILRDHGQVDVLIHNAGKSLNRSVHLSYRRPKDLFATTGVNYLGPARLTLLLLPYMRARRSGHIINIATAGLLLFPAPRWGFTWHRRPRSTGGCERWPRKCVATASPPRITTWAASGPR